MIVRGQSQSRTLCTTLFFAMVLLPLTGCVAFGGKGVDGVPLDRGKIELIAPGRTTFSEVLNLLGPPKYIIDGTQSIVDYGGEVASLGGSIFYGLIPTRILSAPDGMVILIYTYSEGVFKEGIVATPATYVNVKKEIRSNELFIYVTKKDRVVRDIFLGNSKQ